MLLVVTPEKRSVPFMQTTKEYSIKADTCAQCTTTLRFTSRGRRAHDPNLFEVPHKTSVVHGQLATEYTSEEDIKSAAHA
jgi:hypothetical protein